MEVFAAIVGAGSIFLLMAYAIRARMMTPSEARLRYLSPLDQVRVEDGGGGQALLRRDASSIPAISRMLDRRGYSHRWSEDIERAGLSLRPGEYFLIRLTAALIGFALPMAILRDGVGLLVGFIVSLVAFMLPAFWLRMRVKSRIAKINAQLVETITLIANAQRAGFAFSHGVDVAAKRMEPPISVELNRMLVDINLGASTEDALRAMNSRIDSDDVDMVVTAILIQRQTGGNLAEVLESVTETMRDRERIQGEIRTLTSQQRLTGWILSLWPVALGLIFFAISPRMMSLMWRTEAGILLLIIWTTLTVSAAVVYRKILDIDV